jgi:hypothetical protein
MRFSRPDSGSRVTIRTRHDPGGRLSFAPSLMAGHALGRVKRRLVPLRYLFRAQRPADGKERDTGPERNFRHGSDFITKNPVPAWLVWACAHETSLRLPSCRLVRTFRKLGIASAAESSAQARYRTFQMDHPHDSSSDVRGDETLARGEELLEHARQIARDSDRRFRKLMERLQSIDRDLEVEPSARPLSEIPHLPQ